MSLLVRLAAAAWWLALGLWLAAIVTAGVAAAFTFGNLKETGLVLPDHPVSESLHWRYAAGRVMIDVFWVVDVMQFAAAALAIVAAAALLLAVPGLLRRWSVRLQLAALLVACGSFGTYAFTIAPGMNATLRAQWAAARSGDEAEAERLRAEFNDEHVLSTRLMSVSLAGVLGAGLASACAFAPGAGAAGDRGRGPGTRREPPALLGGRP